MKHHTMIPALLFAAGVATAGGPAYAGKSAGGDNDAASALARAMVSLVQAIGTAEAHAGGKAAKAELEDRRGTIGFEVEVVRADGMVFEVKLDADGKVLSSKQDDD